MFKRKKISIIIFLALIVFAVAGYINSREVDAFVFNYGPPPSGDNVSGFAWSPNIGWISFNAADCDLNSDGVFGDAGAPAGCPAAGPVAHDYGVKIDFFTGALSGEAWSNNVGWISFEENTLPFGDSDSTTNPDYDFSVNCSGAGAVCTAANNCTACYRPDAGEQKIYGWAKILSLGDNGWIRFDDHNPGLFPAYGVSIDPITDEVSGWAYNEGVDGVGAGWISFDCSNEGVCGTSPYGINAVVNLPPTAENLTVPNWPYSCIPETLEGGLGEVRGGWLDWDFVDPNAVDFQDFYRVRLIKESDGSLVFDTGKCEDYHKIEGGGLDSGPNCRIAKGEEHFPIGRIASVASTTELSMGASYRWAVRVWDDKGASSILTHFDQGIPGHVIVDGEDDFNDSTFTIDYNQYPIPSFSWLPEKPSKEEFVTFWDDSVFFDGQSSFDAIAWEFSNTNTDTVSPTHQKFFTDTASAISHVSDSHGYTCSTSTPNLSLTLELPSWIEAR